MITKSFDKGQIVFKKGDYSECMYDILSGKIGVYDEYGTPDEKLIAELGEGQSLGEMGMLEYYPRSATAVALEDGTELAEIGEDELTVYFRNKPEKLFALMKQLSQRLRETTEKYAEACRVVYENDEAEKNGGEKSEALRESIEHLAEVYSNFTMY
jgi:CRP-like cAMP-binding protein